MSIKGQLWDRLLRHLPQNCLLCASPCKNNALCAPCRSKLPLLEALRCPVCALPTPQGELCGACLAHPPHFDATLAVFRYQFPVDKLIHALKYRHRLAIASLLGGAIASELPRIPDLVVPMPLSPQRLRMRGFNQAVAIGRHLGLPLLTEQIARRDTPPQAELPWRERAANVRHAFECGLDLRGKHIAIIDDVMTTGATLNELARTLKNCGALRVENWVVARALKN